MRVLHLPIIIANQPWIMSRALRKIGVESDYMILDDNEASWHLPGPPDCNLNIYHRTSPREINKISWDKKKFFLSALSKYDVFHYHSNWPLFDNYWDLKILKILGKKIVVSYWGCDIRQKSINQNYPYNICQYCIIPCREKEKNYRKNVFAKYADLKITHLPDLMEYAPKGSVLLKALIDVDFWRNNTRKVYPSKNRPVRILHSFGGHSSCGDVKGTTLIEKIIRRFKKEGHQLEYVFVDKVPNYGQKATYLKADFVIEQIRYGVHGLTALEAMALERPVIAYIREKYLKYYHQLPIINANPDNLYEKIKWVLDNPDQWGNIGKKSREYVIKNHDSRVLGQKLYQMYKSLY